MTREELIKVLCVEYPLYKEEIISYVNECISLYPNESLEFIEEMVHICIYIALSLNKDLSNNVSDIFTTSTNVNTKDKALRYNDGKPKWNLVHFESLLPLVRVLEFGAKKYSPNNWKKPMDTGEILNSMMRHLTALMDGEELDKESKLPHIGHLLCNAMFYSYHTNKV